MTIMQMLMGGQQPPFATYVLNELSPGSFSWETTSGSTAQFTTPAGTTRIETYVYYPGTGSRYHMAPAAPGVSFYAECLANQAPYGEYPDYRARVDYNGYQCVCSGGGISDGLATLFGQPEDGSTVPQNIILNGAPVTINTNNMCAIIRLY